MKVRVDGSRYPDQEVESAALKDFSDPTADKGVGFDYERTLGDLITTVLVGRDLYRDLDSSPDEWEGLEHGFLKQIALDLKAINVAMAVDLTTDDGPCNGLTREEGLSMLRNLAERVDAGAEITRRLRRARWGHPSFGGGENWEANQAVKS